MTATSTANDCLEIALQSCKRTYIVLDGIDEYARDIRKELTSWFQQFITSLPRSDLGLVRCLFVSQEDGYTRRDLSMLSQIKIMPTDNLADIEAFCDHWHQKIESKFGTLEREYHVKNAVSARSQGNSIF